MKRDKILVITMWREVSEHFAVLDKITRQVILYDIIHITMTFFKVCPRLLGANRGTIWLGSCLPDHIDSVFNPWAMLFLLPNPCPSKDRFPRLCQPNEWRSHFTLYEEPEFVIIETFSQNNNSK